MLINPRIKKEEYFNFSLSLGNFLKRGVCPPVNPTLGFPVPDLLFCPLDPLPQVLPFLPDLPLPTLNFLFLCPGIKEMLVNFIGIEGDLIILEEGFEGNSD